MLIHRNWLINRNVWTETQTHCINFRSITHIDRFISLDLFVNYFPYCGCDENSQIR